MSFLKTILDERFFAHRQRSTSLAGMLSAAVAIVLFEYRLLRLHLWDWNLLAIGLIFVGVKLSLMTWYYLND